MANNVTITGIKAGTTTITASYTDGGVTKSSKVTFVVNPIDATLTFTAASGTLTYNGSQQVLGTVSYNGDGQAKYYVSTTNSAPAAGATGWTNIANGGQIKQTNAGTYYIFLQATGGTNYNAVNVKTGGSNAIGQKAPTLTFTAVSGTLTYNGSQQNIGTITYDGDGTFQYAVTTSNSKPSTGWTTASSGATIKSSAATAQTYYVWLKASAGTNYSASEPSSNKGTKAIGKATPTFTTTNGSAVYHSTAYAVGKASVAGTIYWGTSTSTMTSTVSASANTNTNITSRTSLGTTTIYAYFAPTDSTNYNNVGSSSSGYKTVTATITQASDASVTVNLAANAGTYNSAATLVASGYTANTSGSTSHGTSAAKIGYKLGAATADNQITWVDVGTALSLTASASAGTYYIYKKWTADGNHSNSSGYTQVGTLTRSKATPTLSLSGSDTTYPTAAVIKATASVAGTVYWGTTSGTTGMTNTQAVSANSATTITSQTSAGSKTAYVYFVPSDTTNYNSLGSASDDYTSKKVTVSKGTPTLTLSNTDAVFHGTASVSATASVAGTVYWGTTSSTSGMTNSKAVSAGTATQLTTKTSVGDATVYAYFVPSDSSYNSLGSSSSAHTSKKMTVSKASDASVTVTKVNPATLTYDGTAKTLVLAADSSAHGTSVAKIGYKLGSAATADDQITWVDAGTALTATTAGTYYIYKKWTKDGNHTNDQAFTAALASNTKVINKATPTMTLANTDAVFHGTASVSATASVGGTVYWGTTSSTSGMTNSKAVSAGTAAQLTTKTSVGDTTVYAYFVPSDTTNYNSLGSSSSAHASKKMTVSKASDASVTVTINSNTLTYDGTAKILVAADGSSAHGTSVAKIGYKLGSAATADSEITWVDAGTALTATTAGTYYIYKKWTKDSNHTNDQTFTAATSSNTKAIGKATPTLSLSGSDTTYPTAAVIKATVSVTGTVYWGTTSSTSGMTNTQAVSANTATTITSQTTAGSKTAYVYFVPSDTTNYNSLGSSSDDYTSKKVTVSKGTATLPTTISGDSKEFHNTARATVSKDYVGGTLKYSTDSGSTWGDVTWSSGNLTANPSRTSVGDTSVIFKVFNTDGNYNDSNTSDPITISVYKADDAHMEVSIVSTTLTYNGNNQTIATVDTSDPEKYHGIGTYYIGYKIGSVATADNQITWNNANTTPLQVNGGGTYYVYYKFTVDASHSNNKTFKLVGTKEIKRATGNISYTVNANVSKYCTDSAMASSACDSNKSITIATYSASTTTNTGASITYSVSPSTYGITIASDGLTLNVANGTSASSYNITARATVASTANYSSAYVDQAITVVINAVSLSSLTMNLDKTTVAYNTSASVTSVKALYTNGVSKDIKDSLTTASTGNPRIFASDTTIATIIV